MVQTSELESGSYWKHLGMMTVLDDNGNTQVIMKITENLKQFYGNVHGGVIASLLDSSIAVAVNQQLDAGEGASTVEIKLNYLRPVSIGTLWAESKILQKGRKIIVGQCEIRDDAGNMVAFGTATFIITQLAL